MQEHYHMSFSYCFVQNGNISFMYISAQLVVLHTDHIDLVKWIAYLVLVQLQES